MLLSTFVVPALAAMGSAVGGATLDNHRERFARRLDIFDDDASPTSTAKGGGYLRRSHGFASLLDDAVEAPTDGIGDTIVGAADRGLSDGIFGQPSAGLVRPPGTSFGKGRHLSELINLSRSCVDGTAAVDGIGGCPTSQSSTRAEGGAAERAVDGEVYQVFDGGSVTHTGVVENQWWKVSFGESTIVGPINVYGRSDGSRTNNLFLIDVSILDENGNEVWSHSITTADDQDDYVARITLDEPVIGSQVKLSLVEAEHIHVAEVQVYGYREYQCTYGVDGIPKGVHTSRDAAGRCFELNFEVDPPTFRRTNQGSGAGIPADCVGVFDQNASANLGITISYVSMGTFDADASNGNTYKFVDGSVCGSLGSKRTATVTVIDGFGGLPSPMNSEECNNSLDYVVTLRASCSPTYSEHFESGQVAQSQCTAWNDFRSSLQGSTVVDPISSPFLDPNTDISAPYPYSAIRMSGKRDGVDGVTSITCSDPAKASLIAKALKSATEDLQKWGLLVSLTCADPCSFDEVYYWTVHNINGVELSAQKGGPLACCGCSTLADGRGGTLRPCVGHADGTCTVYPDVGNINWGGIDTQICAAQSQHMAVEFSQNFVSVLDCSTWTSPPKGTTSNNSPLSCSDVDECTVGTGDCDSNASCTNTVGSFTCECNSGYTGDGVTCTDVDECELGTDNCDSNASCTNTVGSFTCGCNSGYTGDGVTCTDVDECELGTDNCDSNASCTNTVGSYTCTCNEGYESFGATCVLTGETTTLGEAQDNANEAKDHLDIYFSAKAALTLAEHNLDVATTNCEDATEAYNEAADLAAERTSAYKQTFEYANAMETKYAAADALDTCPADRTWKPLTAKISWNVAVAERQLAFNTMDGAIIAKGEAFSKMESICDMSQDCSNHGGAECKGRAAYERDEAKGEYDDALFAVNGNPNIPTINPTTLDFVYHDTDGDLIPNVFDACPTKMGLRKDSPEIPGPQDFCPSGCPELLDENGSYVDSDGDGFPDCEDRCPFQHGIKYNHNWFKGADLSGLPRDLDYNGCPDKDDDGIPDIFDACPDQKGGSCYSGCPDRGVDPSTGSAFDADLDGVPDCQDRCPNTYGVGLTDGCPDLDMDGVPDHRDYCMATPGSAEFSYKRKLEDGQPLKYLNILGCPDADDDLVPDSADLCDAPAYPNQGPTTAFLTTSDPLWNGVAIVDKNGCPLDSDDDGIFDGIDMCDDTVHSQFREHDPRAIVFSLNDEEYSAESFEYNGKLGCPKDSDNDGVVDGIDQCPTEGGYIHFDGCPIDTDRDGVKDCVSDQASPNAYVWPLSPTACHSTEPDYVDDSCCTNERDFCPDDTPRGATVYANKDDYALFHPDLFGASGSMSPIPLPGCSYDSDTDGVDDGVDVCPGTTPFEIDLAATRPEKATIDDSGCPYLTPFMWDTTFVDVTTTESNGANPSVELLFTVDADLINVLDARQYIITNNIDTNEMLKARLMDATCQNTFDDVTDTGEKLLPISVAMDSTGSFTGQTPFDSSPFTFTLDLNPDGIVGSPIWTIEPPFDVGSIDFCLSVAILSDTKESVTMAELKTTILIDMTQDFSVIGTQVERAEADESTKLIDVEYPIKACQCTDDDPAAGPDACVDDTDLDDSFLAQGDALRLCVRFADKDANDNTISLPPPYVQMADVKTFTCRQDGLTTIPIQDFVRDDDGGQVVSVETVSSSEDSVELLTADSRMTKIDYIVPPPFFGPDERPLDCTGTIVLAFTEGKNIGIGRRVLAEVPIAFNRPIMSPHAGGRQGRRVEIKAKAEAQSDFAVEAMLAKANSSRLPVAFAAGMAVAGVIATVGAVVFASKSLPILRCGKLAGGKIRRESTTSETDIESTSAVPGKEDSASSEYEYAQSVHSSYGPSPTSNIAGAYAA